MGLAFLNPLLWLGLLALGVPLWLHLRRRMQSDVVRFSALRFLEDQAVPRRSPLRLRDVLLFLLRVLAVLALVAAFAWPYYRTELFSESRVYVLDNTLSHQANGGFEAARARLVDDLSKAGVETQLAVVELTARPRVIADFGETRETAIQRLRALEPSFQRGSYGTALRQADALLANALGAKKQIVVLSDNQANQWAELLDGAPPVRNAQLVVPAAGADSAPNLAVARPQVQRTFVGNKSIIDLAVELHHEGEAKTAVVRIAANGQEIQRRTVELANQPKSLTVAAQWEADPLVEIAGEVTVSGEPDALAGDNRAVFALPPVREGRVALLARSVFLRTALAPEVMRGYWAARVLEPADAAAALRSNDLADVLCVESRYFSSEDVQRLVEHYLNHGRGVVVFVDQVSPLFRPFLKQLGVEPQGESTALSASTFRYVFTEHPIFRPFRSPDFGNLTEIKVARYQRLSAPQAVPLVYSQSGDGLLFDASKPGLRGRLLVCAFGLDRRETDWPLHPTFLPFLDLCLQNVRSGGNVQTAFEPGETFVLNLPPEKKIREFVLSEGERELNRGGVKNGRVEFPVPDKPGIYRLAWAEGGAAPAEAAAKLGETPAESGETPSPDAPLETLLLSVNPSPLESELAYVTSTDALQSQLAQRSADDARPTRAGVTLARTQILRQHLWWFLALAGLAFLLLESLMLMTRGGPA